MNKLNQELAKKLVSYVDKEHKFPATLTVDGVKYNYGTFTYILASTVVNINDKFVKKTYSNAPSPQGTSINKSIPKTEYIRLAREVVAFMNTHKRTPNYLSYQSYKIKPQLFSYCFAKIIKFYIENKRYPTNCTFNTNVFKSNTSTVKITHNEVFDYFVKIFGNVTTFDEALQKVKEKGYAYYYDDTYTNKQSIDRMKAGKGVNCTDSCQVFYHIAKALGYSVSVVHVYCTGSGGGHVRLVVSKNGKSWNRDPACVLSANGKAISEIWCSNGKLLGTNPKWFMDNVNR